MKHFIFISMASLIGKIAVFGVRRTHVWETNAPATCHHLVWILNRRGHTFLRRRLVKQQSNSARYSDTITRFFLLKLADMCFQQDGATCHATNENIQLRDISWSCTLLFRSHAIQHHQISSYGVVWSQRDCCPRQQFYNVPLQEEIKCLNFIP